MSETFMGIFSRMKERLPDGALAIEGTFTGNNLLTVADELARMYSQDIDTLLPRAFADSAQGSDLDSIGEDIGVVRKPATCAEAMVTVFGEPGSYTGILAAADNLLFWLDDFTIDASGMAVVRAVCQTPGQAGNVPAGAIRAIRTSGVTLASIINTTAAMGGYDGEADQDYRARILAKKRNPVTGGSREDYRQWALSVPGVGRAKVIDLFAGPGTVGIYIIAADATPAQSELLETVYGYIETVRPCGAHVEVLPASPLQADVEATVVLAEGVSLTDVREGFLMRLGEYMESFPFIYKKTAILSYMKIADLLIRTEGVVDVTELSLNGQSESITLEEIQFPTMGTITLKEAGV